MLLPAEASAWDGCPAASDSHEVHPHVILLVLQRSQQFMSLDLGGNQVPLWSCEICKLAIINLDHSAFHRAMTMKLLQSAVRCLYIGYTACCWMHVRHGRDF